MKTRILVLGSGMAVLSALFEITSQPAWQDRFEITVLQQGWRAGGKCASSRDPENNFRNFEHGLHILGGFYHNTFRMLIACYEAWGGRPLSQSVFSHNKFSLMQRTGADWKEKPFKFPKRRGKPGVDPTEATPKALLEAALDMIVGLLQAAYPNDVVVPLAETAGDSAPEEGVWLLVTLRQVQQQLRAYKLGPADTADDATLIQNFKKLAGYARLLAEEHRPSGTNPSGIAVGDLLILLELVAILGAGFIADKVFLHGFDRLDDRDALEWLDGHGASKGLLKSTFVNSGYDYAFAYEDGHENGKNFAAGVAIRGMLRLIVTYHDAVFFHMKGGMGEIVILPLFEVLRRRGVRFHFFHKVTRIEMDGDRRSIGLVAGKVQAPLMQGLDAYDPIATMASDGRRYWPSTPRFEQLQAKPDWPMNSPDFESWWYEDREIETDFEYRAHEHFDIVLSGIPIAALQHLCPQFSANVPGWSDFVAKQRTSPTIAMQYWFRESTSHLGNETELPLITGYVLPASTWCDMSFLLPQESYQPGKEVHHLSYACGPFPRNPHEPARPDSNFDKLEAARARAAEKIWNRYLRNRLLPDLPDDGSGDFQDDLGAHVHVRANISPSERYALSTKGSIASRPKVDGFGFDNFFVVGDWTRTGTNVGAVESAVTSGLQACRAISGLPQYIYGETDFP
ncbi:NAD(P)-binding protein [Oleomonas cavernae]|uniref:NAD(P)-binding protein n=1 Tax=Oleomonas cavernae TaxID=2320859 RepID=UPI001313FF6C|nr:NAD(P)-binding protein [Oleomonas cavernae]